MEILSRVIYFLLFDSALPCGSLLVWNLKKKKKSTEIMNITLSNLVLILTKGGVKKKRRRSLY